MKRVVHTKLGIYVLITTVFMKRVVHTKLGIYVLITHSLHETCRTH